MSELAGCVARLVERIIQLHDEANWSELSEIAADGASMDELANLSKDWLRLKRVEEAAAKYRLLALERPGESEGEYLPWLMRFNSAGNELAEELTTP
jgi:hypothetical protein